jgi:hypothetical protein
MNMLANGKHSSLLQVFQAGSQVKQQVGPQMFIVKMLIISNTDNCSVYIKWKEGGKKLAAGEKERECV